MNYELCIIHYALIKKGGSIGAVPFLFMSHIQITDDTFLYKNLQKCSQEFSKNTTIY